SLVVFFIFFLILPPPPTSTLFPYTTLFRSVSKTARPFSILKNLTPLAFTAGLPFSKTAAADFAGTKMVAVVFAGMVAFKVNFPRSEEHTSELQSLAYLVCRLLLEKKKQKNK